jgi:hypothetical protein
VTARTPHRRHTCSCARCESPRRRYAGAFWLAVLLLGLAHGWLHFASADQHGHFAHNADECCLVQSMGGGTAPPLVEVPLPAFTPVPFIMAEGRETCGLPASVGYCPRDPPLA